MYTFKQSTGELFQDGKLLGKGWAGQGLGKNNPAMQDVQGIGPLPQGRYLIGKSYLHPKLGPLTFDLTPYSGNAMYGRSLFRIHGAALKNPELSSEGCIIQIHEVRQHIDNAPDRELEVTE